MTAEEIMDNRNYDLKNSIISKIGKTFSIDFGIGNQDFLGKGYAAKTLISFCEFFKLKLNLM